MKEDIPSGIDKSARRFMSYILVLCMLTYSTGIAHCN
jgi:hypothetical protein